MIFVPELECRIPLHNGTVLAFFCLKSLDVHRTFNLVYLYEFGTYLNIFSVAR